MKLFDLDGLPQALERQLAGLATAEGDAPQDRRLLRQMVRRGYPASEYFGIYVAEAGRLLSKVETVLNSFTLGDHQETVVGITGVITDPDAGRRGLARAAFEEVHRREKRAGRDWAFLWTRRTWGAHRLYEKLGYRDVFFPPSAARRAPVRRSLRRRAKDARLRVAHARDAPLLERLLATSTQGRIGFLPRFSGSFRFKFEVGWRTPENHLVLETGGRPVGYAHIASTPAALTANEVLTVTPELGAEMVHALERVAAGRWLCFAQTTFASDHRQQLYARGYGLVPSSHLTLMAKPLAGGARRPLGLAGACARSEFSCHRGDVF